MRFIPDGPDIPEELLTARDKGEVIFFCGAGVSRANAGLPDFFKLAEQVIDILGAGRRSPARQLLQKARETGRLTGVGGLIAADRVFGLLEREFEVCDVREAVAAAIRPAEGCDLTAHKVILNLARNRSGVTRLVTTNFDLLFEACDATLVAKGPPHLPDPRNDKEFQGIIHLHGKVTLDYASPDDEEFVVSSADFGRAYLADGWATKFIQSLLQRYYIVFVGYTADDPPVQYLLEALNLDAKSPRRMFAFQEGDHTEASALWERKGVTAIPFPEGDFASLWSTLAAWSVRARDLDAWYAKLFEMASVGPSAAGAHVRGQILSLAATTEGATRIARAGPQLDARWLLVLDSHQRYLDPSDRSYVKDQATWFDPFHHLSVDTDPSPMINDVANPYDRRKVPGQAVDVLIPSSADVGGAPFGALRSEKPILSELPIRLFQLGQWFVQVAHDPVAVWWAVQQTALHPKIRDQLEWRMRQANDLFPTEIRRAWRWLLTAWADERKDPDSLQHLVLSQVKAEGWSPSAVRSIALTHRPKFTVQKSYGLVHPLEWEGGGPTDQLLKLDVDYPHSHRRTSFPPEMLPYATAQFRSNIDLAISMEAEVRGNERLYFRTLVGDQGEVGFGQDLGDLTGLVTNYLHIVDEWFDADAASAKREIALWPVQDNQIYARLRIWAAGQVKATTSTEAADIILALSDEAFWSESHTRELLFALRQRWQDLDAVAREAIENKILHSSQMWPESVSGGVESAEAYYRLQRLNWLSKNGVDLSFDYEEVVNGLRQLAPDWKDDARDVAETNVMRVVSIGEDNDPGSLLTVRIKEIVEEARRAGHFDFWSQVRRAPFHGLVESKPKRALKALSIEAKSGRGAPREWADFLYNNARVQDSPRMKSVVAGRLIRLPALALAEISHPAATWFANNAGYFFNEGQEFLPQLWEQLIAALWSMEPQDDHKVDRSWADSAINAAVGELAKVCQAERGLGEIGQGDGLTLGMKQRFDDLLSLPGVMRSQAIVMISRQIKWLDYVDPVWTRSTIAPLASDSGNDGDAFWEGLLWAAVVPSKDLYLMLKAGLLERSARYDERSSFSQNYAGMVLAGWGGAPDEIEPERLVTNEEMREFLIVCGDDLRSQVLWNLRHWSKDPGSSWHHRLISFLTEVWPKQRSVKTQRVANDLIELAMDSGDLFPSIVSLVCRTVVPASRARIYGIAQEKSDSKYPARRYPSAMLDLLWATLGEDSAEWPYDIDDVFAILEEDPAVRDDGRFSELRHRRVG
ncbi:SIR2 family protein [Asticcacaulis machinosus]|uniref:SIR2 family protein n=1 Tax=Asticcacaulis machinosus TaxID=2984211 RepID=A0ABT5HH31_9CAUL|nr:SIR2 family protein [Asticcacaulis machinosus]MDC7675553.1 SIR2 family protein [Asticcacaulis machinosus]